MSEYRVWECQNCGWIYDEAKGWPEDNIAPGTRWEEIPEDWCCPECGASKSQFAMREVSTGITRPSNISPSTSTATYRIWECMVCGWVYDESRGCPEEGITAGTRWEDIPEDWSCPQCGVSKEEFDMVLVSSVSVETSSAKPITNTGEPLVILGTGLAGYNLAREFRKLDNHTPMLMITADDGAFYSKPLLSASLSHGKTAQQLSQISAEEMARELDAEILVHTRVSEINPKDKTLTLHQETGEHISEIHYDRLVLATGACCPPIPHIEGDAQSHLFRINNLGDYHRFRTALVGHRRVILIGAGLIGCEFANDLVQAGFAVEVVEPLNWPLGRLLPEQAGRDLQRALEKHGVRFHFGSSVQALKRTSGGLEAQLVNGETIQGDIALAALGLKANIRLAETAGLAVERGISVSRHLQTSNKYIFALGDCAEVDGHQLFFVAPLIACARALAKTLSGEATPVNYGAIPVAVKTTLHPTTVCPPQPNTEGRWQVFEDSEGVRAEYRDPSGKLRGFALTGSSISARDRLCEECVPIMDGPPHTNH
ncbi:FAD-dependent oxidoreductase [Microbulbifer sp. SSSA007]|uniref:FAD-dependent oxidoreductase n=1 Tax=Microbulbifer sp. SSSA007 TaxID=3243379 RepID=UPI004039B8DF